MLQKIFPGHYRFFTMTESTSQKKKLISLIIIGLISMVFLTFSMISKENIKEIHIKTKQNTSSDVCLERTKFVFMKTHKTGSRLGFQCSVFSQNFKIRMNIFSAVQNILLRYALYRNLNAVLQRGTHYLNKPEDGYSLLRPFKVEWLEDKKRNHPWHSYFMRNHLYDYAALHTVWNYKEFRYGKIVRIL